MTLEQFTFDFYLKLRQRGMSLTIGEYKLLLEALQKGLAIKGKKDFLEICQLLWCKSLQHQRIVLEEFQFYYQYVLAKIIEIDIEKEEGTTKGSHDAWPKSAEDIGAKSGEEEKLPKEEKEEPKNLGSEAKRQTQDIAQSWQEQSSFMPHNSPFIKFYPAAENEYSQGRQLNADIYSSDTDYIHSPFILSKEYLPVSLRQMQQAWRSLRHFTSSIENAQSIDWQQTINNTAQRGFFHRPAYSRMRNNQFQLVILIDHHGSMVPHWTIGQQLIEAAKKEGGYPDAKVYYTHNIPSKYLYKTPYHTDSISVEDMLQEFNPRHTVFMFFSDAGASRGLFNAQRVIATKRFVTSLGKRVHSMVWLNPMPKERWVNTSAELIKRLVPMFECTEGAIDAAINTLKRGRDARV